MTRQRPLAQRTYALQAFTPLTEGEGFVDDFTDVATRVRQTRRRMGGFWDLSFTIPRVHPSGHTLPRNILQDWFYNRLFFVVKQVMGGATVWRGVVWRMDLTLDGVTLRKDYGALYNAVQAHYTDTNGNRKQTAWYTDDASINRFGRREQILYLRNVNSAAAIAEAQTALLEQQEPWPKTVSLDVRDDDRLDVMVAGLVFTANNKFVGTTTLDATTGNLSAVISDTITNDCAYLSPGRIDTNTIQYKRSLDQPARAWDFIVELTEVGDGSNPFISWVSTGDFLHYGQADNEPLYHWKGREGLATKGGPITPYDAWGGTPAVLRDLTRPSGIAIPGSFLGDSRDSWIYEMEMADGLEFPMLKPEGYEEDEIKRAMQLYRNWLEMEGDEPLTDEVIG
jgi:hypothetical protein